MKRYFQDNIMQKGYENLIKKGLHHFAAIRKVQEIYDGYDTGN